MSNEPHAKTELSTDEARQGRTGRPILVILVVGLLLAGIAALFLHPYKQGTGTIDNSPSVESQPSSQPTN